VVVDIAAHQGVWIAGALFLISLGCWRLLNVLDQRATSAVIIDLTRTVRLPARSITQELQFTSNK
jgi:hypothetical protein